MGIDIDCVDILHARQAVGDLSEAVSCLVDDHGLRVLGDLGDQDVEIGQGGVDEGNPFVHWVSAG